MLEQFSSDQVWYSTREVAERLGVDIRSVRFWVKNGELPAIDFRGAIGYKISESALEEFLRQRQVRPMHLGTLVKD